MLMYWSAGRDPHIGFCIIPHHIQPCSKLFFVVSQAINYTLIKELKTITYKGWTDEENRTQIPHKFIIM